MTGEEYEAFMTGKTCAICGTDIDLVLDHDHETNKPRGVLCRPHNAAVGIFLDDRELLFMAIDYLTRNS